MDGRTGNWWDGKKRNIANSYTVQEVMEGHDLLRSKGTQHVKENSLELFVVQYNMRLNF